MFSQLAKEDLDDLRAEGLKPTDEDIIRLHALAAVITDGPETTAYNFPRHAHAGGIVFYEPTMASFFWYYYAKQYADDTATEDWLFAFACAHGRDRGYLRDLKDPEEIQCALGMFIGSCTATKEEVDNAVYYVSVGDNVRPEKTALAKKQEAAMTPDDRERANYRELEVRLSKAAAVTGFTYDELMCQTPSRLRGYLYEAHVEAGMKLTKSSAKAHADYLATLHTIAERLRNEKKAQDPPA